MTFIADFHIHSHYSMATSIELTPANLNKWAKIKGITVLGTGDCIHPGWLNELKDNLVPEENGLFCLKSANDSHKSYFILTTEISSIYKKNGKVRKVHNICVLSDFDSAEKLQNSLSKIGNIHSDGRPILGLDSKNLLEMVLETSEKAFLIPAHIWTPWFSVLGSRSGFDSIEECFEDLTQYIFAVETGLSSDPPMNRRCSFLDPFTLVSNSDAHSLQKLGREATLFDTEISFQGIYNALKTRDGFAGTIEFFPQEGKYYFDGHRKCDICWNPVTTIDNNSICPKCGKPVTKGVMYRVTELADRTIEQGIKLSEDFYSITSLIDIISEITNKSPNSKTVQTEYLRLIESLGAELEILLNINLSDIKTVGGKELSEGIKRLRAGYVSIKEGFDGEFGEIKIKTKT
ncbi:MAG: DNA helicase UvrD [Nitrospirae bacterium]|nr:DNA helicase UvrD [Nitrospirota bacterium]